MCGVGYIGTLYTNFLIFLCKSKTVPKNKVYFKKKTLSEQKKILGKQQIETSLAK